MLTSQTTPPERIEARNRRLERKLWEQPEITPSIGCGLCPQLTECGGLHTHSDAFDCMAHCCNKPTVCTKVCRLKPNKFVQQVREIAGFGLGNTPLGHVISSPDLPCVVPLMYHGNRRERFFTGRAAALSLYRLLHRATGEPKYGSEAELRTAFGLAPEVKIILTGTDQDPPLERWWAYGAQARSEAIAALRTLGVSLVTTPNYSLLVNAPRWDDLHSMKRIALINAEFLCGGLASALHVNARTETDIKRWADFVAAREEVNCIAYEFTTGSGRAERLEIHAQWLADLAKQVSRPLKLVVRGGFDILPILSSAYESVTVIETSAFMKTMKRQRAVLSGNSGLIWVPVPTPADAPLDDLFEHNLRLTAARIELLSAPPIISSGAAAA